MALREYDSPECSGCGMFNVGYLYCDDCVNEKVERELKDLQGAYDIAMTEISCLRRKLGYDSPKTKQTKTRQLNDRKIV